MTPTQITEPDEFDLLFDKAESVAVEERDFDTLFDSIGDPEQERRDIYRRLTDTLLDNKDIVSFLESKAQAEYLVPTEPDTTTLRGIIDTQPDPEQFRAKLAISLYLANTHNVPFADIHSRFDAITKEVFGPLATPKSILAKILAADKTAFDLHRDVINYKSFWDATKHAYKQTGMTMVSAVAGVSRAVGEMRSGISAGDVQWAENLADWGARMQSGVEYYYKTHPEEFIQVKGDGFWDTTVEYLNHPVAIYQGVLESMPLLLGGIVGGIVTGGIAPAVGIGVKGTKAAAWVGRVQGMAVPLFGQKYSELRANDVPPSHALPQAFLTSQGEAIIEEWTLGKKLTIFKGAGTAAKKGIANRVTAGLIGTGKAYGRGTLEEGTQAFSENFWNWVFTDRDQKWMEGVMEQAAAGGPMETVMAGGFKAAGRGLKAVQNRTQVDAKEKLRRVEIIRNEMLKSELTSQQVVEVNKVCDDVKESISTEEVPTPVAPIPTEVAEVPEPQNVAEEINQTPRFGVMPSVDGKTFTVMDWSNQHEIETSTGERYALNQARRYNVGELVPADQPRAMLPEAEKGVFTVRQVLNYVMKGMSKAARQGWLAGARDTVAVHKNLGRIANEKLKNLDITRGQRRQLIKALTSSRTKAQKVAALATINILAEQAQQAKAIKGLKKTIAYINRKIGVVMQKKGIREEFYVKIKALTDSVLLKPNSAKQQRAVRSLRRHLENLQKNASNKYEGDYQTELIPDSLIKRLDRIEARPVKSMTAEQITELDDSLRLLIHLNNTKNRLIKDGIARDLQTMLDGAIKDTDLVNDISPDESKFPATEQAIGKYGALHSVVTTVAGAKNHDVETLTDTLSGGHQGWAYQVLVEGIAEGRENTYEYSNRIKDEFRTTMESAGVSVADLQKMSHAFLRILKGKRGMSMRRFLGNILKSELTPELHTIQIAGVSQQFTMGELMMIYMHAQASFNLSAMIDQGVSTWRKRLGQMTPDEVFAVTEIVENNPKAKAFVDMAAMVYETISKVEINKVSTGLIGINLAKEDNYAHVERYRTGGVAGAQRYRLSDLEQEGRLQSRQGSKEPIIIRDFFEVFHNDMQAISEYVGMAEPLRTARNLVNYGAWRDILRDKGYAEQLILLDEMLHNIQALPEGGDAIDSIISAFMRGTVRAVLAEPGIFLGQYTSLNGVFNETSRKYATAIRVGASEKDVARYKEHFPSYKARVEGGVSSATLSYLAQNDAVLRAFTGKADFISTFTRLIHAIDMRAITDICRIVEAEMQDGDRRGKAKDYWEDRSVDPSQLEVNSEEYWREFVKRAGYIVRRTQPMFTPESKSVFTANKSAAKKMWFLFRSYIDQPLRMASRSLTAYKHGKISSLQLAADLGNIWATLALYAAVRYGVGKTLYRNDDEWTDLLLNMLLAPVRMLALVGYPLQIVVSSAFKQTPEPSIRTVPVGFADRVFKAMTLLSQGTGYMLTEERFKSGPNKGELKGPIVLGRGFTLLLETALMFYGVPEDVPRRIYTGWTKKEKPKGTAF